MHFSDFQIRAWQIDSIAVAVGLEAAGGDTSERQVLELIGYLDRRGMLSYLVAAVRRERPGII
jgi:hypothetical protein